MSVFNIPLNQNLLQIFKEHIFACNRELNPNFSQLLVLVPSKQMANNLKMKFASKDVISPKIISLAEVNEDFLFSLGIYEEFFITEEISDFQTQVFLFQIAKQYLSDFSTTSIFSYINDFRELENSLFESKTEIAETLTKLEGTIANFAEGLQNSLITFLKILQEWQRFKRENKKITRFEKNILSIECLIKNLSNLPFKQIYIVGASGTNQLQTELITKIAGLANGSVFLSGLETEGGKALGAKAVLKLCESLNSGFTNLQTEVKKEAILHFAEYDNILIKANQIALIASQNIANNNIGIVAGSAKTAGLIGEALEAVNIPFSTVFTETVAETEIFKLLELITKAHEGQDAYLALIKHSFTTFEEVEAKNFEKQLRKPNLFAYKPFEVPKIGKSESFFSFLEEVKTALSKVLKLEILEAEIFLDFAGFLEEIKREVQDFSGFQTEDYFTILTDLASKTRFKSTKGAKVSILSIMEARAEKFDLLFITDLSSVVIPERGNKNKILNGYLQEMLGFKKNLIDVEWFDFTSLLHSAEEIFLCFAKTNFEEKKPAEYSPFLQHALLFYKVEGFKRTFYTAEKPLIEVPNPAFNLEVMPSKITPTSLKNLINNPYLFYVSNVICLKNPNEISNELERRIIGEIIHDAIFNFFEYGSNINETCKKVLFERGFAFNYFLYESAFYEISDFFLEERQLLLQNPPVKVLMEDEISFEMPIFFKEFNKEKVFKMAARPDKIEFYEEEIRVIDYKVYSEKIPISKIEAGLEPQLMFQVLILREMMPNFKGNIRLFYYYINLQSNEKVVEKMEIPSQNLEFFKKSLEKLLTSLPSFFYKQGDKNFFYEHLTRL